MIDRGRHNVLGVGIDAVDYECAVSKIITAAIGQQKYAVSALAVHGVMTTVSSDEHRHRLNTFESVVPDGQPVRWALNLLYKTGLQDRVYGPTLTLKVCEAAARQEVPIYLYGSRPDVLERLSGNLVSQFPELNIAGMAPSMFRRTTEAEKQEIVDRIKASGAKITLVGLGCPRQEVWAYEYSDVLKMPVLAVGAAFDFHAGLLKQAPPIMQKYGLEWLFRLMVEPTRLWQRYLVLNPWYVSCMLMQMAGIKRFDKEDSTPPKNLSTYG
jgi:exopolysaccharide biosynthesis WecB/TagA/CpsF family protein